MLTDVARLAWVEQRWSRHEGDGIWHQNDELLRHEPAHVAHRQPEAEPEEPEEQRVDLLQVISEPQLRSNDACWNFHHFDIQSTGYLERETRLIPPTVYSRLFEFPLLWHAGLVTLRGSWLLLPFTRACFLTTLTFRALHGNHIVMVTLPVHPRLLSTTLTISVRFVFRHPNPRLTNDLHDLPQWFRDLLLHLQKRVVMVVYPRVFEIASL